ncbi:MAG TPA: DUF4815 domain-containing protein, partial [Flavobacteriales bacterium]|nr:DUF4815 domain-containing protein [Flavobacteriales bacterium]
MPLTTNATPYWDDYNEDKQFYRILFRPGYAVQARELTQLQTNLQKQIEYHGKHIFQHGSRVLDGQIAYNKCEYIKLADYTSNDPAHPIGSATVNTATAFDSTTLVGITIQLDSRTATFGGPGDYITNDDGRISSPDGRRPVARVVLAENRTDNGDPATLLLNYESGDKFTANDFIIDRAENSGFNAVVNNTISSSGAEVGQASYAGITSGVYFITTSTGGYFTHVPKQRIILDKYSDSPTYKIGLKINETIVTEAEDGTLFDNAQGTYTTYAPGAHRLKIALDLAKAPGSDGITINPGSAKDFVEILRIENGQRAYGTAPNQDPVYNMLGEAMAKRTFDESGNYIVDDFDCRVEDGPADTVKVTVQPKSGKTSASAYIRGHQYEQAGSWVEYIQKARKTAIIRNVTTPLNHGAFMLVTDLEAQGSQLSVGDAPIWDLHTVNTFCVNVTSSFTPAQNELAYKSTLAGRFRIRDVQYVGANTHAIYVTDFEGSPALTGNFFASPGVTVDTGGTGANEVKIRTANTSVWNDAYVGAKFTITWSHDHPDFAGQTRTVVRSDSQTYLDNTDSLGTRTLYLDSPFNQPTNNTAHFPGLKEKFALNADVRAAATLGNTFNKFSGSIIASAVNDSDVAIGAATGNPDLPANKYANANISTVGTIANTSIFGGGTFPSLIFKMPVGGARVANSIDSSSTGTGFEFNARYSHQVSAISGDVTFSSLNFRGTNYTDKAFFKTDKEDNYTVINETTGQVIGSADFNFSLITENADGLITAIKIESDFISGTENVRLIGPVLVKNLNIKSKTLVRGINAQDAASVPVLTDRTVSGNSWVTFTSPNTVPGEKDNLGLVDVYRLVDVYDTGDPSDLPMGNMLNNNQHRVTNNYVLDAGQSEALYDYASVVLKPGAKAPKGQLAVVVDRFIHDNSVDAGMFTVDSYNGQVSLENIPSFVSNKSGQRYKLGEYLDFRPSRAVEVDSTGDANTSYYVPFASEPNSHTADQEILHPDSQGHFQYDMQFFAPRFDKIVLSVRQKVGGANTGYLRIVSGSDDRNPAIPPRVDPNDMALFTLALPSYTPNASDINILEEGNRRWTMKDISKINKRVDRLEYYSSLNM